MSSLPGLKKLKNFELIRTIGEGGMGVVYEAIDRDRNLRVALKTLLSASGDALLRFKREFHEFRNIEHPNLISLHELYEEDGTWFFTMDLLEGGDLTRFMQELPRSQFESGILRTVTSSEPPPPSSKNLSAPGRIRDEELLRNLFYQLATGLLALHATGKIHRDIKPTNIFVTKEQQVVLLDYGIATDLSNKTRVTNNAITGTPHYMAPEQMSSGHLSPAADWYSVGVILYEALTGAVPFHDAETVWKLFEKKQNEMPLSPKALIPSISEDLSDLCMSLIATQSEGRISGEVFLHQISGSSVIKEAKSLPQIRTFKTDPPAFAGRLTELKILQDKLHEVEEKREAIAVCVFGESGVGKSALIKQFVRQTRTDSSDSVVLAGRCYERRTVPFNAIDGVVDELSRYILKLPPSVAATLLPRHTQLLIEAFPVLKKLETIGGLERIPTSQLDPQERRTRVFSAFREMFVRLCDRTKVIIAIDDLQWADGDSLSILNELLRRPDSPSLLLVSTSRRPEDIVAFDANALTTWSKIYLERLSHAESVELAEELIRRTRVGTKISADRIVDAAGGHPTFIAELVRHRTESDDDEAPISVRLEDALWSRIRELEPETRSILEALSLATGPLEEDQAVHAAGLTLQSSLERLKALRNDHLIQVTRGVDGEAIEPYHDTIREAVRARVTDSDRMIYHRRIAEVLEQSRRDVAALAFHWKECGEAEKSARYYLLAAENADNALAFERAARLYQECLRGQKNSVDGATIYLKAARAFANAGIGKDSADCYRIASTLVNDPVEAYELRRSSADQLLRSGHIDEGLNTLETVLLESGTIIPRTSRRALISFLWGRFRIFLFRAKNKIFRTTINFAVAKKQKIDSAKEFTIIDMYWTVAVGAAMVNPILGLDFQTRYLLGAFRLGEPSRIINGLLMEGALLATGGVKAAKRAQKSIQSAEVIAGSRQSPNILGFMESCKGVAAFQIGHWKESCAHIERAITVYRNECVGVHWELGSANLFYLWSLWHMGEFSKLSSLVPNLIQEADVRGDIYIASNLRISSTNSVWLFLDQPDRARREAEIGRKRWISGWNGYLAQDYYYLSSMVNADLYEGNANAALSRFDAEWDKIKGSLLPRMQSFRVDMLHLKLRATLAASMRGNSQTLQASARKVILKLKKENVGFATAFAALGSAALCAQVGNFSRAEIYLREAINDFDGLDMYGYLEAARRRLMDIRGLTRDGSQPDIVDRWATVQKLENPQKMIDLLAPGFASISLPGLAAPE